MNSKWQFRLLLGGLILVALAISLVIRFKPVTPPLVLSEQSTKLLREWEEQLIKFMSERRYDKCELLLRRILKIEPNNLAMQRLLGKIWYETGEFEQAENIFRELLLRHPKDVVSRNNYGMTLCAQQQFESGVKELKTAYLMSGGCRFIGLNWAAMIGRMGEKSGARELFQKVKKPPERAFPTGVTLDAVTATTDELMALEH